MSGKKKKGLTPTGYELPEGITLEQLQQNWDEAMREYAPAFKRMRIIDGTYRGRLWKVIQAKLPKYQILSDTNHVAYIVSNILASLYSVGRSGTIQATNDADIEIATHLSMVLEHIWDTRNVSYYQMLAGERAAVTNLGITEVGWDDEVITGRDITLQKGSIVYKNVDPISFMRDPYAESMEEAGYAVKWDSFHKQTILRHDKYKESFKHYLDICSVQGSTLQKPQKATDQPNKAMKDRYDVVKHYIFLEKDLYIVHTIDNKYVLHVQEKVMPNVLPFAELYCNLPSGDVVGTSEPSKIFANSVAYNWLTSTILTAEYKRQNPTRYVNVNSQINLREFMKQGTETDQVFQVQGDASKAVHSHEHAEVSAVSQVMARTLGSDIQTVTGITGKYTGSDTGSILTTGGMEQMLDQATMIDAPKIANYEEYTRKLTHLTMANLIEHGNKRKYLVKNATTKKHTMVEVAFDELKDPKVGYGIFHYPVNISPHLPKNKAHIAQMATVIMEKQMQYNGANQDKIELITPQEWLSMQDLPMKEQMLDRMNISRSKNFVEEVTKTIFQYADLLEGGMDEEAALVETANALQKGEPSQFGASHMNMNQAPPAPPMEEQPMDPSMGMGMGMEQGFEEEDISDLL